jgi:hypothetical protein
MTLSVVPPDVQQVLGFVVLTLFGCAYTVATIAWLAAAYCLWQTMANRRPGVRLWGAAVGYFPLNIVFRPDLLTERGQLFRRRFGQAVLAFAVAVATGLVLDGLLRLWS